MSLSLDVNSSTWLRVEFSEAITSPFWADNCSAILCSWKEYATDAVRTKQMARTALQNARVEPGVAGATSWDIRDLLTANESKSGASRGIPSKHLILRHLMVRIRRAFGAVV